LRSIKQARQKKKKKRVYSREAGEAEQRYVSLFDRLMKKQENTGKRGRGDGRLEKRAVVRIWKQSQLEDWFLAKVWDQAVLAVNPIMRTTEVQNGLTKEAFVKAMSAIDYELARRKEERES